MGAISLICGIVGIILNFVPGVKWFIAAGLGVLGIIFAVIGKKKGEKGIATAGLVVSIIAAALGVLYFAICKGAENAVEGALGL